jgi:beta-phosphoglucomutase
MNGHTEGMLNKAILWDMDGTLVDSLGHHWLAWRDTAASAGVALTYEQFFSTIGKRNDEIMVEWFGAGMPVAQRTRLSEDKESRYRDFVRANGIEPLPGVRDWMTRLRAAGWKQAVATSAPRLNMEVVVEALGLGGWFDAQVSADEVPRGKPAPDVFLAAATYLDLPPHRCIVIEDAAAGIAAGLAAGMKTVGVCADGPLTNADVWVPSLTELPLETFERLVGG